jgi:hypothetical protein
MWREIRETKGIRNTNHSTRKKKRNNFIQLICIQIKSIYFFDCFIAFELWFAFLLGQIYVIFLVDEQIYKMFLFTARNLLPVKFIVVITCVGRSVYTRSNRLCQLNWLLECNCTGRWWDRVRARLRFQNMPRSPEPHPRHFFCYLPSHFQINNA